MYWPLNSLRHKTDVTYHSSRPVLTFASTALLLSTQVAPAELEEILRSHPDVEDAAVIGVPDDRAGELPRAFIVPKTPNITEDVIKNFTATKLSEHKQLKGGIVFLSSIPKSPSGKILRRELRFQ